MVFEFRDYLPAAAAFIALREQFMPVARWDYRQYSVGYGRAATKGEKAKSKDEEMAIVYDRIIYDTRLIESGLKSLGSNSMPAIPVLASLAYNLAPNDFKAIARRTGLQDFVKAMNLYVKTRNGKGGLVINKGLVNRRAIESRYLVWAMDNQASPQDWLDALENE